jgi:phosphoribosylanthranilate isomerase
MSSVKLKICGMRDPQNILDVGSLHPDYMGFIFFEKSPRDVGNDFNLPVEFPIETKKVGVFVNAETKRIIQQAQRLKIDVVQLHGKETVAQCDALRSIGIKVVKVFSVDDGFDFRITIPYKKFVNYFLFDTKGKYYGGNAQVFNWNILEAYDQEIPFFLSGGLNPDNIKDVTPLKNMNLHAIDVNSGVEKAPAKKDIDKIKELQSKIKLYL